MTKRIQGQDTVVVEQGSQEKWGEHEEHEEHEEHGTPLDLSAMMANTPDAFITLDKSYRVYDLNRAACNALGWSVADARGRGCPEVLGCHNLNHVKLCGTTDCPLLRVMQQEHPLPHEDLIIGTKADHLSEVSTSVTLFTRFSVPEAAYPVAEQREQAEDAENKVQDADSNLTRQKDLIVFIARDVSALKVANLVRSNFVSMVSHELRTPLNSVHGFIDLLLQGHMGPLNQEQEMYLGYTQQGVQQLVSIVEDILFMTRSDLGQFQVRQEEVPLRSLVRQVISGLQPQVRKAEVVLRQDIAANLPTLYIDPKRIIQVLNNLIVNAIKFTPPGQEITVKANRYDANFVIISVTDTGFGIPQEDQQHVFERFYQSNHHQQSKMGGYGLGLSIAKLIVEQHGGIIGLESVVDEGTTFFFTMPIYKKHTIKN